MDNKTWSKVSREIPRLDEIFFWVRRANLRFLNNKKELGKFDIVWLVGCQQIPRLEITLTVFNLVWLVGLGATLDTLGLPW